MVNNAMRYLLDTNICIALIKDVPDVRRKVIDVGLENCLGPDIAVAELYYGAAKSERPEHFDDVDFIVQHFEMLSIDPALETYGRLKHELEKQGCPIDDFDLLIGAIAKQSNLTLVTHNTKHFSRIPDILLEDWIA